MKSIFTMLNNYSKRDMHIPFLGYVEIKKTNKRVRVFSCLTIFAALN